MDRSEFRTWCIDNLLPALSSESDSREVLEGFFDAIGALEESVRVPAREGQAALDIPETCPASPVFEVADDGETDTGTTALDGLLANVGFSAALPWLRGMSDADKRRLVLLAARLWRAKGTPDGTRMLLRFLLGRDPLILDWPFLRYVVGDPFPLFAVHAPEAGGDLEQTFWLADPDATVDRSRVAAALATVKPAGDSWTILWSLLAETFGDGLYQWDVSGGATVEGGAAVLPAGSGIAAATGGAWEVGRVVAFFEFEAGGIAEFRIGTSDGEYLLAVSESGVLLQVVAGGVASTVANVARQFAAGTPRVLDWRILGIVSGTEFRVNIDGNEVATGSV